MKPIYYLLHRDPPVETSGYPSAIPTGFQCFQTPKSRRDGRSVTSVVGRCHFNPAFFALALLLYAGAATAQTTIRVRSVDNLQTLINNATAGTTFLVEAGVYGGTINVNKRVTLIGTGYFLGLGGQATGASSEIGTLTFQAGGEFSTVMGFVIGNCNVQTSNVLVSRNAIGTVSISKNSGADPILGIVLKQNYISGIVYVERAGCTLTNNLTNGLSINSNSSGEIKNNVIYGAIGYSVDGFSNSGQVTIKNNIIRGFSSYPNLNSIEYNYIYQ